MRTRSGARYFEDVGGTREDLAAVAVKNHRNALGNENARFQKEISTTEVLAVRP